MKKSLLLACGALAIASAATAQDSANAPFFPPFGYDLTAFDKGVKPGDDFFQYANGSYLARTQIPADRPIASRRYDMTDRTEAQLMGILREASVTASLEPSDVKGKVGAFYAAYMDQPAVDALGAKAIAPELDAIRAAPDLAALAALMGASNGSLYASPFGLGIDTDLKNPDAYALYLGQGGLGFPTAIII